MRHHADCMCSECTNYSLQMEKAVHDNNRNMLLNMITDVDRFDAPFVLPPMKVRKYTVWERIADRLIDTFEVLRGAKVAVDPEELDAY